MKKLISIALLAGTVFAACGCAELLASLANTMAEPSFMVPGDNTVYNGQTVRLTTMGTGTYEWSVDKPDFLKLEVKDGSAYVTGTLALDKNGKEYEQKYVTITAKRADDESISPVTREVYVRPWYVTVFDAEGNAVKEKELQKSTTYTAKMTIRTGAYPFVYKPVEQVYSIYTMKEQKTQALTFKVPSGFTEVEKTEVSVTFKTPSKAASGSITAKLGHITVTLPIATK